MKQDKKVVFNMEFRTTVQKLLKTPILPLLGAPQAPSNDPLPPPPPEKNYLGRCPLLWAGLDFLGQKKPTG